jgi:cytochrome subunit of sulfide dehydrogenase
MARSAAAIVLALGLSAGAAAEDGGRLAAYGRHLAQECTACHRSESTQGAIPPLAGRPAAELAALLADFREGRKTNPIMVSVAKSLDATQTAALALYFSSLPKPAGAPAAPKR